MDKGNVTQGFYHFFEVATLAILVRGTITSIGPSKLH